jgi:cell division protease FtsH
MSSQTPSNNPLKKFRKSTKSSDKSAFKKSPQTRSQKIFKGPLFWIILAIFAVTIFGQITSAANRYTQVKTSQVVDAISKAQVESAVIIDKSQKIQLILTSGNTIKGSSKVEASYVARQEPTLVDALTANPPTKGWNVDVPTQSFLTSLFFTFGPILVIGMDQMFDILYMKFDVMKIILEYNF